MRLFQSLFGKSNPPVNPAPQAAQPEPEKIAFFNLNLVEDSSQLEEKLQNSRFKSNLRLFPPGTYVVFSDSSIQLGISEGLKTYEAGVTRTSDGVPTEIDFNCGLERGSYPYRIFYNSAGQPIFSGTSLGKDPVYFGTTPHIKTA